MRTIRVFNKILLDSRCYNETNYHKFCSTESFHHYIALGKFESQFYVVELVKTDI